MRQQSCVDCRKGKCIAHDYGMGQEEQDNVTINGRIQDALLKQTITQVSHKADSVTIHTGEGHTVEFLLELVNVTGGKSRTELHAVVKLVALYSGKATI